MSDKETAEEIAKTIPCRCCDCGMRELEAAQMIQTYADQELASLREHVDTWKGEYQTARRQAEEFREQLKQQEEITQDERLLIKRIWSRAYMDTEEDHIKLIKAYASNQLKQKEDENRELVEGLQNIIAQAKKSKYPNLAGVLLSFEALIQKAKNLSA